MVHGIHKTNVTSHFTKFFPLTRWRSTSIMVASLVQYEDVYRRHGPPTC